jgi:glycine cleavage system regulatory protein
VLSALGRDRVGLADELAEAMTRRQIEIEDTRMATLKGQFAAMLHLRGKRDAMSHLSADLSSLAGKLRCHMQLEPIKAGRRTSSTPEFLIESFCPGAGGLGAVTAVLKRHDINIEDLKTEAEAIPWSSKMSFHLTARVSARSSRSAARLREELRALEKERDLDIVIKPGPTGITP